ncbi:hypothetical protein SAMN05216260_106304 [Streptomyces griseoaurantiacus]|uniref:Uncharacterized protein n=1 Tax=Streptomyces griseoaurantiacus TaxID=68213 RepID=A0A1G7J7D0_9ACTN|nr:hypothetical protein SAMN05216260_106304 [Streptomyces jietaisiensis]
MRKSGEQRSRNLPGPGAEIEHDRPGHTSHCAGE